MRWGLEMGAKGLRPDWRAAGVCGEHRREPDLYISTFTAQWGVKVSSTRLWPCSPLCPDIGCPWEPLLFLCVPQHWDIPRKRSGWEDVCEGRVGARGGFSQLDRALGSSSGFWELHRFLSQR